MTRPRSMTILGWLLIIGGLSSLYDGLSAATQPDGGAALKATGAHLWPYVTMNLLDAVISSACGFGVLAGVPWARLGYLVWAPILIIYSFIASGSLGVAVGAAIWLMIIATFLCRRPANIWFEAAAG